MKIEMDHSIPYSVWHLSIWIWKWSHICWILHYIRCIIYTKPNAREIDIPNPTRNCSNSLRMEKWKWSVDWKWQKLEKPISDVCVCVYSMVHKPIEIELCNHLCIDWFPTRRYIDSRIGRRAMAWDGKHLAIPKCENSTHTIHIIVTSHFCRWWWHGVYRIMDDLLAMNAINDQFRFDYFELCFIFLFTIPEVSSRVCVCVYLHHEAIPHIDRFIFPLSKQQ